MLKNTRTEITWLGKLYSDIFNTSKILSIFKRPKLIALLKPGKVKTEAANYQLVALLSVTYKLLEGLILNSIQPIMENYKSIE